MTLFIVSLAVFALATLPSDPARAVLGREATPENVAAFREKFGLDQPPVHQYTEWLKGLLTGDPGISFSNGTPIMDVPGRPPQELAVPDVRGGR